MSGGHWGQLGLGYENSLCVNAMPRNLARQQLPIAVILSPPVRSARDALKGNLSLSLPARLKPF